MNQLNIQGGYFMENLFMMKDTIKNNSIIPMVDLPYAMVRLFNKN